MPNFSYEAGDGETLEGDCRSAMCRSRDRLIGDQADVINRLYAELAVITNALKLACQDVAVANNDQVDDRFFERRATAYIGRAENDADRKRKQGRDATADKKGNPTIESFAGGDK